MLLNLAGSIALPIALPVLQTDTAACCVPVLFLCLAACAPGFGKADASSPCTLCPFGTYNLGNSDSCNACPSTTYNDPMGDSFTSYGITFNPGMSHADACVPRYAQLPNPAGNRMVLPSSMFTETIDVSTETSDELAVDKCVKACPADKCCIAEMAKGDDGGVMCKHARLTPTGAAYEATAKLFYKIPPSEFAAAGADKNKTDPQMRAKTIGSGLYAACDINTWKEDAVNGLVGTSPNPLLVEVDGANATEWNTPECNSIASCKAACLTSAPCWGFIVAPIQQDGATVPGFALRGGEMFLGGRTFFVSPDGAKADSGTADVVESWSALSS